MTLKQICDDLERGLPEYELNTHYSDGSGPVPLNMTPFSWDRILGAYLHTLVLLGESEFRLHSYHERYSELTLKESIQLHERFCSLAERVAALVAVLGSRPY